MNPRVLLVLRSGGVYEAEDVRRLAEGIRDNLPRAEVVCLSDVPVEGVEVIPLEYGWPGWWSKMEMFRPDIQGGFLYLDLDTIITGDLSDLASLNCLAVMRDVYRPNGLQSAVMFVPEADRAEVWQAFTADPEKHIRECVTTERWGDQGFLEGFWLDRATRIQDALPGQVESYKAANMAERGVPRNCRAVVFHGQPKPRDLKWAI